MSFKEAAKEILSSSEKALSAEEITEIALTKGLIKTEGKTPWFTMFSHMNEDIRKLGDKSFFSKPEPGLFAARHKDNFQPASSNTPNVMMGKKEAAKKILSNSDKPLTAKQLTDIALEKGLIEIDGKTPWSSMSAAITTDIKQLGDDSFFVRAAPGLFAARYNNVQSTEINRENVSPSNANEIIYVAENLGIPDYVKIGMCENKNNLAKRIKDLSNTSVPFPFALLYVFLCDDAREVERTLKQVFQGHLAAKQREFYEKDALEDKIYPILKLAGKELNVNEINNKVLSRPTEKQLLEEGKKASEKRMRFNFQMVGIEQDAELVLRKDKSITCKVIGKFDVDYKGQKMSLSASALEALKECGYNWTSARGSDQWIYEGETLTERRDRIESE